MPNFEHATIFGAALCIKCVVEYREFVQILHHLSEVIQRALWKAFLVLKWEARSDHIKTSLQKNRWRLHLSRPAYGFISLVLATFREAVKKFLKSNPVRSYFVRKNLISFEPTWICLSSFQPILDVVGFFK
jgi:hypothetical protein